MPTDHGPETDPLTPLTPLPTVHGFLIAVEAAKYVSPEALGDRMADALRFVDGVGVVEVNYLGEIELLPEAEQVIEDEFAAWQEDGGMTKMKES